MAGERIKLEVQERSLLGSAATRRLRKQGLIPGVIYGHGKEPRAFAVEERELRRALTGAHGLHAILDVKLEGESNPRASVLKDYQRDRVRDRVVHIDLLEVSLDETIQSQVTIELTGESPGVKQGGVLSHALYMVSLEAKPLEIPEHVPVDIGALNIGDSLRVADLPAIAGVTYLDDPETVVASVTSPTEEVPTEAELEAEAEAEAAAEGEAAEGEGEGGPEAGAEPGADGSGESATTEE
jgi:large subunit ribosomal protein L25